MEEKPQEFCEEMVTKYPKANKRMKIDVSPYNLAVVTESDSSADQGQTIYLSPHGMEFHASSEYPEGTLLKISINLPNYWKRKQQFVSYSRIDVPSGFGVLAKVVRCEDVGKRGKKKRVLAQMVNIDETDELVLKTYLNET